MKVNLEFLRALKTDFPKAFPASGRVNWLQLPESVQSISTIASGNVPADETKEELEKVILRKRARALDDEHLVKVSAYLEKDEYLSWLAEVSSDMKQTLIGWWRSLAPKLAGKSAAEIEKSGQKEIIRICQLMQRLVDREGKP